jgi:uncharacterized membrane protein
MTPASARRCRAAATIAGLLLLIDWAATIADVGAGPLNLAFTVLVMAIFPAGYLAVRKAPPHLRRWATLTVASLFIQIVANAIWYVDYLERHDRFPGFGAWTVVLYLALISAAAAAWTGVREILRARDAFVDYSIVMAAAVSVAGAIIGRHLGAPWTASTISDVISAVLSLLIVVIIGSAALGRWQALPFPVGLVGLSLLFDAAGFLISSYSFTEGPYTNNRWPTALWLTAAAIGLLAALAVIAGEDRPIHLTRKPLPGTSPASVLVPAAVALAIPAAIALHGAMESDPIALYSGLGAVIWIAVATLVRSTLAVAETRAAYSDLDGAHLELERAHERSSRLVTELGRRNLELTTIQTMLGEVFEIADERSEGQLRSNLESAGADLTEWLPRTQGREDDQR